MILHTVLRVDTVSFMLQAVQKFLNFKKSNSPMLFYEFCHCVQEEYYHKDF